MSECGCNGGTGGPFSKGRELVDFVYNAHRGTIRNQPIGKGALAAVCQRCNTPFTMETYIAQCPECGGVHTVSPMNPTADNIQFGGKNFTLQ
jgi:hypothetical protein